MISRGYEIFALPFETLSSARLQKERMECMYNLFSIESVLLTCHRFRLVKCQLNELVRLRTDSAIKKALRTLPRDLDQMYETILRKITDSDIYLARTALLWLTYASRPLKLKELAEGAILNVDMADLGPDDKLGNPEDILDILGSLVSYMDGCVELSHNSVRDYLRSPGVASALPAFYLPESRCVPELATLCLNYLLLPSFSAGPCNTADDMCSRLESFPLLFYISHNWPNHARPYLHENRPLFNRVTRFFASPTTPQFVSWVQVLLIRPRNIKKTYKHYPPAPTPLYYATSFGLVPVVEHLLANGADVNEPGGRAGGTPLHGACWRSHPDLVRLLLRSGADFEALNEHNMSALEILSLTGDETVRRVILEEKGIDFTLQYRNPIKPRVIQ